MVTLKLMSKQDWHLWMRRQSLYTLFLHIVRTNARKGFWLIRSNKITILSLSVMSCRRTWAVIKPFHFKNIPFPVFWLKSLKNKFWKLIHEMGDKRFLEGALLQDNTSRDGPQFESQLRLNFVLCVFHRHLTLQNFSLNEKELL